MNDPLKHKINPMVDCVFKAILGSVLRPHLLKHFLNGILKPKSPIVKVVILNPYNEKEYKKDKLTIVDIKATDEHDNVYQIEVQLKVYPYIPVRMLHTWSDVFTKQADEGDSFYKHKPVIAIWLLGDTLFRDTPVYHHHFQAADLANGRVLSDHMSIHTLELKKWQLQEGQVLSAEDQWLYFFSEGKHWTELPAALDTEEMRQAMAVLKQFSEKQRDYDLYQARQKAIRDEASKQELIQLAELEALEAKRELAQTNVVLEEKKVALEEKSVALEETNVALEEKSVALEETNVALEEKSVALEETNVALEEKNVALEQKDEQLKASQAQAEQLKQEMEALKRLLGKDNSEPDA